MSDMHKITKETLDDELERLEKAATPEPWKMGDVGVGPQIEGNIPNADMNPEMLERAQWYRSNAIWWCPVCGYDKRAGHAADCKLAALTRRTT